MEDSNITPHIPAQKIGEETNIETKEILEDLKAAKNLYALAKSRLLNVNKWHELCGKLSSDFKLTDSNGEVVIRFARVNDYFKINIPGPGTTAGEGYDWVRVEKIEEKKDEAEFLESIVMTVRPAENPAKRDGNVAHFFADSATSNFTLLRNGNIVSAAVYGRNEMPNIETDQFLDKARNAIISITALAGMSKPQWKKLINSWLKQ